MTVYLLAFIGWLLWAQFVEDIVGDILDLIHDFGDGELLHAMGHSTLRDPTDSIQVGALTELHSSDQRANDLARLRLRMPLLQLCQ